MVLEVALFTWLDMDRPGFFYIAYPDAFDEDAFLCILQRSFKRNGTPSIVVGYP